jgi:hypothetical protein
MLFRATYGARVQLQVSGVIAISLVEPDHPEPDQIENGLQTDRSAVVVFVGLRQQTFGIRNDVETTDVFPLKIRFTERDVELLSLAGSQSGKRERLLQSYLVLTWRRSGVNGIHINPGIDRLFHAAPPDVNDRK